MGQRTYKPISFEQLTPILDKHELWLAGVKGGERADLSYYDLSSTRVKFSMRNLNKANFTGSNLEDTLFHFTDVEGADFSNANLQNADFRGANLTGVLFKDANLSGIVFENANLKNTIFQHIYGTGQNNNKSRDNQ